MEVMIGVGIGMMIGLIARTRNRRRAESGSSDVKAEHERHQKTDIELITIILPTINN